MTRVPQRADGHGSLKWIQKMVNQYSGLLDEAIGMGEIDWRSPLAEDDFAEYRDESFLERLDIPKLTHPLSGFWPKRGPQWDALGIAASGERVLVEAKANLPEILSSPLQSTDPRSTRLIRKSLEETAHALRAKEGTDWSKKFYQYANRLAHAHFLKVHNGIPTQLVFLYFIGDADVDGPQSRREWEAAIAVLHEALGITGKVPKYVTDAFVDVSGEKPKAV